MILAAVGALDPSVAWSAAPPPTTVDEAIVASPHPLATGAGQVILAAGGNAIDAAVAISFAIAVVEPWASGIGGGAFVVTHLDGDTTTWDMRETAPAAAHRDMFVEDGAVVRGASVWSARAAGIPGLVRGMVGLHRAGGQLPLEVVLQPAITYARDGFPVSPRMAEAIAQRRDKFNDDARRIFLGDGGAVPTPGTILRQHDLARTLARIVATEGEDFYTGDTATELVRSVRAQGGIWTEEDLARYRPVERPPVRGTYRGYEVASMGPPSSGGLLLVQMLAVLEPFELDALGWGSAAYVHTLAETMKRAFALRASDLGDPDQHAVDHERFVGDAAIARLRAEVAAAERATPPEAIGVVDVHPDESTHTSHFGVLLANGDAVACTQTINLRFGTGRVAGRTGVLLNNEMDDFSAKPGAPNAFGLIGDEANSVQPHKRPLSSMTPTILIRDGRAVGVVGSPGGSFIITTTLQTILHLIDHGMGASAAIAAPRVHHQWYPDALTHEPRGLSPDTIERLEGLGHVIEERGYMGNGSALWRRPDGALTGAADPRGEGSAAGL